MVIPDLIRDRRPPDRTGKAAVRAFAGITRLPLSLGHPKGAVLRSVYPNTATDCIPAITGTPSTFQIAMPWLEHPSSA